jgi:poly-gamma-glutamate capsule biosynthesis protein CapA/YwtB (metallophosphatase superfamily)
MKKQIAMIILGMLLAATMPAQARNVKYTLSVAEAMATSEVQGQLDGSVKFYFGPQKTPQVLQKLTTAEATTKGNVVEKIDLPACNNAFAWALKQLQDSAKAAGANAVVNIVSSYKKGAPFSSATEFECHAGLTSAGLTLKGDVVKTADK